VAAERAAPVARELAAAASALLADASSWLGGRFVVSVHQPWITGRPHAPSPESEVLGEVLRRLGEQPSGELLVRYVAADARLCAEIGSTGASAEERSRFDASVPPLGEVPDVLVEHACPAYDVARDGLARMSAGLEATGGGCLAVEAALTSTRWWPGRNAAIGAVNGGPLGLVATFRSLEWRSDLSGDWRGPWQDASDLAVNCAGLPPFGPEDWILAAFRHRPVEQGGLGLR
jgi:hypothetical protein